jgi:hypothetical protein
MSQRPRVMAMKSRTRIVLGIGLAAMAVVIAFQFIAEPRSTSHVEAEPKPSMRPSELSVSTAAGVDRSMLAASAAQSSPAAAFVPADKGLQRMFAASRDWRAFALAAKDHPESGGRFYAIHAANLCARDNLSIQKTAQAGQAQQLAVSGTVSNERLALTDSLATRCSAFVPAEAAELVASLRAQSKDGADPLLAARQKLLDGKERSDATEVRESVRRMLATGDPLLLSVDDLLMLAMSFQPKNPNERSYWFDGQSYDVFDGSGDALMLKLAVELGTCAVGAICALDDKIAISCISQSDCITDRVAYLQTQYLQSTGASPDGFVKILALADKVRSAIQARNVDAFVRPG